MVASAGTLHRGTGVADNWTVAGDTGGRYFGEAEGGAALEALRDAAARDPSPENEARLALAHFQCEQYGKAAEHYKAALDGSAGNGGAGREDWSAMLAIARANAAAEIHEHVPDVEYYDRDALLAPPRLRPGAIPDRPAPVRAPGPLRRARIALGKVVGEVVTVGFGAVTQAYGRACGYRDEVWTNWYRRRLYLGILTLAYMREQLERAQPARHLPAPAPGRLPAAGPDASAGRHATSAPPTGRGTTSTTRWRARPARASPATCANAAIRPETGERLLTPNPREISRTLLARGGRDEGRAVPQHAGRGLDPVPEPRLDQPRREPAAPRRIEIPLAEDDPARAPLRPDAACTSPAPSRTPPGGDEDDDADHVHQRGHPLVGRLADLRQRPGDAGPPAQRRRRQAEAQRRTAPSRSTGKRRRGHRHGPQLVGRPVDAAHAVRARAQRDLRPPQGHPPGLGRHPPVQRGPAGQRRRDGEDPHASSGRRRSSPTQA